MPPKFNAENFIEEVRNHQYLYDMGHQDYKDQKKKDNRWAAIGAMFNLSATEAYKKWKGIRDRFKREKNLLISKKKSGSGKDDDESITPKWKIYPMLKGFLDTFTEQRESVTNIDMETAVSVKDDDGEEATTIFEKMMRPCDIYEELSEDDEDEDCTRRIIAADKAMKDSTHAQGSLQRCSSTKKRKLEDMDKKMTEVLNATTTSLSNLVSKQGPKDSIFHFFISLMGRFRQLNCKNQRLLRLKVENIFYELEEQQDN